MMATAEGIRVNGTLLTVPVEELRPEDLIIKGHALRTVVSLGPVYLGYQRVHVQAADHDSNPHHWGYWTWEFLPGTPVLIVRPVTS